METNKVELRKKIEDKLKKAQEEKERKFLEYWNNLPKFEEPYDVPNLPRVDEKEWKEFYVPRLIKAGAIPKKDLIDGQIYIGDHRNANIQKWDEKKNKFIHMRYKFGWVEDECNHFEDDDGYALFVPFKLGTQEEWDNRLKK